MEMVTLGSTGRRVSRLGFGGAPAGLRNYVHRYDPSASDDRGAVVAAIRRAVELGITYFDTAPAYGDGASEEIFREGLADVTASPSGADVFLATKCAPTDAAGVRRSLEASLGRLGRDSLDLIQVHGSAYDRDAVERILAPGGMVSEMERLRDEGLVRHIGFTGEAQDQAFYALLDSGRFEVMQVCYNLIFQHPYDPYWKSGSIIQADSRGMGVVTMRPLTSGLFQRWLKAAVPEFDRDVTGALLQIPLSNPLVDVTLVGMRTAGEVERNVAVEGDTGGRIDLREVHEHYERTPAE